MTSLNMVNCILGKSYEELITERQPDSSYLDVGIFLPMVNWFLPRGVDSLAVNGWSHAAFMTRYLGWLMQSDIWRRFIWHGNE